MPLILTYHTWSRTEGHIVFLNQRYSTWFFMKFNYSGLMAFINDVQDKSALTKDLQLLFFYDPISIYFVKYRWQIFTSWNVKKRYNCCQIKGDQVEIESQIFSPLYKVYTLSILWFILSTEIIGVPRCYDTLYSSLKSTPRVYWEGGPQESRWSDAQWER